MFEFDQGKSLSNLDKHGIDFKTAVQLWDDPNRIVVPAISIDEPRYVVIAKLESEIWSAIYTYRKQNIRIISVRKSRKNEKEIYYSF